MLLAKDLAFVDKLVLWSFGRFIHSALHQMSWQSFELFCLSKDLTQRYSGKCSLVKVSRSIIGVDLIPPVMILDAYFWICFTMSKWDLADVPKVAIPYSKTGLTYHLCTFI